MPEYTIDINLNSARSGAASTSQAAHDVATPKIASQADTQSRFLKGMKRLNVLHSSSFASAASEASSFETKSDFDKAKQSAFAKGSLTAYMATAVIATTWNAVKTYAIDNIAEKYGDQARQNQANNILKGVGVGASILGGAASGLMAGAMGGPVLAAVGAMIGTVTAITNQAIGNIERELQWQRREYENTIVSARATERLGLDVSKRNRTR
jgi:hypothetical protein